ncbi:MAG: sugar ABC transporter ATP-binding protein [Rhodobacteraceae bacterium PARR1]|nr:MAG: sugar ABC transporter ATP-binding protein [Rhodobacteraceae bacterium PARR1]
MAEVTIRALRKTYGGLQVIHGLDLDIPDGAFVVLVGPSGCGKSTLLRMIAGLEEVTGGDVNIGATRVNNLPPSERDIAMVFQNYALYPHKTVAANMGFALKMRGMDAGAIRAKVEHAAGILGLTPYLDRYPRALSGGQRLKTTTVYVTHDQIEAMTMADKIVVMQGGRIEQVGAPLELYDRPANAFVAAFIGSPSMNLLEGRISGGMVDVAGTRLPLPPGVAADEGRDVIYGIRPEHLHQADSGLTGTVAVIEPTGSETHVVLRLGGREITAVFRNRVSFGPGATITLAPEAAVSHLFDKATGQRI